MKSRMAALVLAATLAAYTVPAMAENNVPSPTGSNPTAQSVTEQQVLEELGKVKGRGAIPDPKEVVLEQPQGREYQAFHERLLPWIGGILTLEARDLDHAVQLMSQHPGVQAGPFEIRPAADLGGMVDESELRRAGKQ